MTATILGSSLNEHFELLHFDTTLNRKLEGIGRFRLGKALALWKQYRNFSRTLKKERPDLVVVPLSQTPAGLIKDLRFVRIARRSGIRTLAYLHGGELDRTLARSSRTLREHAETALRKLDGAVVLGDQLRHIFRPYLPEERIFTVPNGMDVPLPEGDAPEPPPYRLLFLSNPIRRKGIEDLLEAVRILRDKGHPVRADVAGEWFEPSLERTCKKKVEQEGLPVEFHAPLDAFERGELLKNAHIFIMTPRKPEGMPVALIEALAHGLPIISTEQGAIPEMVSEGWNGHLVLPRDPVSIAEKVAELTEDPVQRASLGVHSRERYQERFTEKALSENSYHCFKTLLEHSPRG